MQTSFEHPTYVNGQLADSRRKTTLSKVNELKAQITDATVGGTTDGVYTVRIAGEEGTFDVSFTASGNTADQIAAGLEAAADSDPELLNIASFASPAAVFEITFLHPGRVYNVSFVADPSGSSTVANSQNAGGSDVFIGTAVKRGSSPRFTAPLDGTTKSTEIIGIVHRSADLLLNDTASDLTEDRYVPGHGCPVLEEGSVIVDCENAHTDGGDVFARRTAAAGQRLGAIRQGPDGDSHVVTVTPTPAAENFALNIAVDYDGDGIYEVQHTVAYDAGGLDTATDICDALRTALGGTAIVNYIAPTGTATLVLLGVSGVDYQVASVGEGAMAVAITTQGTVEAVQVKGAYFEGSGSGLAKVVLNK